MNYVALRHWLKFQTNFTTFQGVTSKKPPIRSLKLKVVPSAGMKTFEISKLQIRHK